MIKISEKRDHMKNEYLNIIVSTGKLPNYWIDFYEIFVRC